MKKYTLLRQFYSWIGFIATFTVIAVVVAVLLDIVVGFWANFIYNLIIN